MTAPGLRPPGSSPRAANVLNPPNLLIVDAGWTVIMMSGTDIWHAAGLRIDLGSALPDELRALVDAAFATLNIDRSTPFLARISPWPNIAVSVYAVRGERDSLLAISAQPFRARKNLIHAQREYGLSPRELEILRHVLSGAGTSRIASALNIADSTVIAHVKSLLLKTKAANRAALVARVLGWEEPLIP